MTQLQRDRIFLDTYIREASLALNTINYVFDGHEAATARGFGYHTLGTDCYNTARNNLKQNKTTSKWIESSTNYDNHWMALREAHVDWEQLLGQEHSLATVLMNLECSPANMGYIDGAEPAPTSVSTGFNILPKFNNDDKLICTFNKYSNTLSNSYFKMTVKELNFV